VRAAVEPFLEAWEIMVALQQRRRNMRFEFDHAELVDRDPPGPGEPVELDVTLAARAGFSVALSMRLRAYPQPPAAFVASEDVRSDGTPTCARRMSPSRAHRGSFRSRCSRRSGDRNPHRRLR